MMRNILLLLFFTPSLFYSQNYQVPRGHIYHKICEECEGPSYTPIGWSKKGNLAFLKNSSYAGYGGCKYEIIVQNLGTDKILNAILIEEDSPNHPNDNGCDIYLSWRKKQKSVDDMLGYYEITNGYFGDIIEQNSVQSSTGTYSFKLSSTILSTYDNADCEGENKLKYYLKVYLNGKSVTVSKNYSLEADDIEILGYYRSPVEERILIILQYSSMGCDEYDHYKDIIMVGCELNPKWWE